MQDYELRVPFGVDAGGHEVRPENALPMLRYVCPDCRTELVLRRGTKKRTHFAHKAAPGANCDFLNETEEHYRAKLRLAQALAGGEEVFLIRRCRSCDEETPQRLPSGDAIADTEFVLPSGHRADVALRLTNGNLRAIFEVLHRHPVDDEKARAIAGTPWAELRADAILAGNDWPLVRDHLIPWTCRRCRDIARFGKRLELLVPGRKLVACPLPDRASASVIDDCAFCLHFVEMDGRHVLCLGGEVRA